MKIAFAGMGIMGSHMAINLLKAGYAVTIWNRSQNELMENVLNQGASLAIDINSLTLNSDVILMCLGDEKSVEAFTEQLPNIENKLVVDFTTIGPKSALKVRNALLKRGGRFMDAPISGGEVGAKQGTLSIMVGGTVSDFKSIVHILNILGSKITLCGSVGSGQSVKLINQLLCAVNLLAVKESCIVVKSSLLFSRIQFLSVKLIRELTFFQI